MSGVVVSKTNLRESDTFRNRTMDYGGSSIIADSEGYQSSGERPDDDRSSSADTASSTTKDANYFEERYRVDRRKLEQMIQDPHIKVSGHRDDVLMAKTRIMDVLDARVMRATLKMDVCHTEHSHIIGKAGSNIKHCMRETACHIHFPDSNRSNVSNAEKSNQVSIAGLGSTVEMARAMIRDLAPLVIMFEVRETRWPIIASSLPSAIQTIQRHYGVGVTIRSEQRPSPPMCAPDDAPRQSVVVRGSMNNVNTIVEACAALHELLTGQYSVSFPVCMPLDLAVQHHIHIIGQAGAGIKRIMQMTGATVSFPDPMNSTAHRRHTIHVNGTMASVLAARHHLLGCLPLVLMFDVREDCTLNQGLIARFAEELNVYVNIKLKPKQTAKTVIIKTQECNAAYLYEARERILSFGCDIPQTQKLTNASFSPSCGYSFSSASQVPSRDVTTSTNQVLMYNQAAGMRCPIVYPHLSPLSPSSPAPSASAAGSQVYLPQFHPLHSVPATSSGGVSQCSTNGYGNQPLLIPVDTGCVNNLSWQNLAIADGALNRQSAMSMMPDSWSDAMMSFSSALNTINTTVASLKSTENDFLTENSLNRVSEPMGLGRSTVGGYFTPPPSTDVGMPMDKAKLMTDCSIGVVESNVHYRPAADHEPHNLLSDHLNVHGGTSGNLDPLPNANDHQDVYKLLSATTNGTCDLSDEAMALLNYIDYEQKRILASRAMNKKPIGESRTPTHQWAGLFFSKSMPDSEIRSRLNNSLVISQDPRMTTTYETSEEDELKNIFAADKEDSSLATCSSSGAMRESCELLWSRPPPSVSTMTGTVSNNPLPFRDTQELLKSIGLSKYSDIFLQQEIDLVTFLTLSDEDLKELGITTFGARRKMLLAIADVNKQVSQMTEPSKASPLPPPPGLPNPFKDGVMGHSRLSVPSQSGRW